MTSAGDGLPALMSELRAAVDRALDARMPAETAPPAGLHRAMRYSVFAGGKRIRPILCLLSAEAAGGDRVQRGAVP